MPTKSNLVFVPAQPMQRIAHLHTDGNKKKRPVEADAEIRLVVAWAINPNSADMEPMPVTVLGIQRDTEGYATWQQGDDWEYIDGTVMSLDDCIAAFLDASQREFDEHQPAAVWNVDRAGNCRHR